MLKKSFYLFLTLSVVVIGLIAANFAFLQPQDFEEYRQLLNFQENSKKRKKTSAEQKRKGVTKDIFVSQHNHNRLHLRIQSEQSKLFIEPENAGFAMIEKLENIQCWLQEEGVIASPRQVRYFTAQNGSYAFPSHEFLAGAIELYFFLLQPEESLFSLNFNDAYLKGYANRLSFFLKDRAPHFEAHHFKATFDPDKGRS